MNVLILGGESPRHYEWVRQVARALQPHFERVAYTDYQHWSQGGGTTLIAHEIAQAVRQVAGWNEYLVVAKSIGTVISTLAILQHQLKPRHCIFLGLPLGVVERIPYATEGLRSLPPTTIVQNEHDPVASFAEVKAFVMMHGTSQAEVLSAPGDTHNYINFDLITRLAMNETM